MAVRLTRAACPGRTRGRPVFACGRAIALLAVLGVLGCASKEGAAPSPAASAPAADQAGAPAEPMPAASAPAPGAPAPPIAAPSSEPAPGALAPPTAAPASESAPGEPPPPESATAAPVPAPERDVRDDIEAFYAGLPEEAIAFHVPAAVPRGQVFAVRLIVEPGKSEAEIERVLVEMARDAGPGEVRTRTARVGDEMQARLSSPTLQIVVRGNDTQLVRRSGVTEWTWDVTATTGGKHRLALTLYAIPQGRGSGVKVKTFEETLTVEVGFVDEVKETFAAHWEWMWTFVLGPIGALVWRRRRLRLTRAP